MRKMHTIFYFAATCLAFDCPVAADDAMLFEALMPTAAQRLTLAPDAGALSARPNGESVWASPRFEVSGALWTRVWFTLDAADFARITSLEVEIEEDGQLQMSTFWLNHDVEPNWEDLHISSPVITAPKFRFIARGATGDSAPEFAVELTSILIQPELDAEEPAKLQFKGSEAQLRRVTDEERLSRFVRTPAKPESTVRGASWAQITPNPQADEGNLLKRLAAAVPRLSRRAPYCEIAEVDDEDSRKHKEAGVVGCTAFRVGEDLFATAWHCLPDNESGGCKNARIEFGYGGAYIGKRVLPEACDQIVYRSARLDFVLFRVKRRSFAKWSTAPVLKFVEGNGELPGSQEPLAILHYPAPESSCNPRAITKEARGQLGLQVSQWAKTSGGGSCKVMGKGLDGAGRRFRLDPPGDPESVCDRRQGHKRPNRDIGFGHLCATCEGSSGAPVISMRDDPARRGKVLGVHVNGADLDYPEKVPNRAVRAHAIADCIDVTALNAQGIVQAAEGAQNRPVCACTGDDVCAPTNTDWSASSILDRSQGSN